MSKREEPDEIEVVDIESYTEQGKPIPKKVKYFLIKVDSTAIRVRSPIKASEILAAAGLEPCDYSLTQIIRGGKKIELKPDDVVDLHKPGVERFVSVSQRIVIIVNGRKKSVSGTKISFSEVVQLAFDDVPAGENICFTVSYRNGPKRNPEGSMLEGDTIKIQQKMIFNVTATDKS